MEINNKFINKIGLECNRIEFAATSIFLLALNSVYFRSKF
jgi:hypothetical protein